MNLLYQDTLRFLRENFDQETSWCVPPSQSNLKRSSLKVKETVIPSFEPIKALPTSKKEEMPEKIAPLEPPILERPKPLIESSPLGIESLSDAVKGLFPQFTTHKTAPQDKDLRVDPQYKKLIQADVVLFSFREGKESDLFLQNIQMAITNHFLPAAVLDAKKWDISGGDFDLFFKQAKAKIFIGSETFYKKASLLPFLKEIPTSSEKFLSEGRLLLLKPFETYFNDPLAKKELWKILCATLKKTFPSQVSS